MNQELIDKTIGMNQEDLNKVLEFINKTKEESVRTKIEIKDTKTFYIMTTQDIKNLTDEQVSDILYALCRSGKAIIPQYYTASHIEEITGKQLTESQILEMQLDVESNETLMEEIFSNIF